MNTYPLLYTLSDWQENDIDQREDGVKVTRVEAAFAYSGMLEGATRLGFVMQYMADGTGAYEGYELFAGQYNGATASVVLRHKGCFDPKAVQAQVSSVDGSGTGALTGVQLAYDVAMAGHGPYTIDLHAKQK